MITGHAPARRQGHGGAVQGPAQAFDDAHDHMDPGFVDHLAKSRQFGAVQADRALHIAQVLGPAEVTAATDDGAERGTFGVTAEKRLGEHRQIGVLTGSVADQAGRFLGTQLWLERNG
ncbi:hypothetical protein D3C72_1907710 [compost metagenome]